MNQQEKLSKLRENLQERGSLAIGFSGGVDSTLLLWVAHDVLGDRVLALTARSALHPRQETEESIEMARAWGVQQVVVDSQELSAEEFISNPPERCYLCKRMLFSEFVAIAKERGFDWMADGTNADDHGDYRPGMQAVTELGIISPLSEVGLTKAEIRALSKEYGLNVWNKPAFACLASRIPYGEKITAEKLGRIEAAEKYLRGKGFAQLRVRHHGDIARIEVAPEERVRFFSGEVMDEVATALKACGYRYVALDLEGYRMGSLNERLDEGK